MAGYSQKSLADKLGIKPDFKIALIQAFPNYHKLLEITNFDQKLASDYNFIQFFTDSKTELETAFPKLKKALKSDGMLWISWPKGSSKIPTDLNETSVQQIDLQNGLVDIKVAAIDETWSGLKFVYRLKDR